MTKTLMIALLLPALGCFNERKDGPAYVKEYNEFKSTFADSFTDQFPDSLEVITDPKVTRKFGSPAVMEIHKVGFYLYEYGISETYIQQTEAKVKGKTIAQYQSTDDCLLVINRFETPDTYKKRQPVEIGDSSLIDQPCYQDLYPVPHFLEYKHPAKHGPVWLNKNFTIYVLEAKPVNPYAEFQMVPNPQMPAKWKNGYSKGIAISRKDKTVIYWSFMW